MKKYYQKPVVQTASILPSSMLDLSIDRIDTGDSGITFDDEGDDVPAHSHEHGFIDDPWDNYPWEKDPWSKEELLKLLK